MKQEEIDDMLKEAPGPVNFTVFLTMFGEKLKGKNTYSLKTNPTKVILKYALKKLDGNHFWSE